MKQELAGIEKTGRHLRVNKADLSLLVSPSLGQYILVAR